jgi:hypothetical protein
MELAADQSLMELMSDWCKRQSCGEIMTRKMLRSAANIKNVQWLIELNKSVMNTLNRKGHRTEACGTPEVNWKGRERMRETRNRDCLLVT